MKKVVVKFGGTSMADVKAINQACDIVKSDPARKYVVVSAPGKRFPQDIKITDMLYCCFHDIEILGNCSETFSKIRKRYTEIVEDLGLKLDIKKHLDDIEKNMLIYRSPEYCASRGEYLSALIIASNLGYEFIDAADLILFSESGEFLANETNLKIKKILANKKNVVIPGFYGACEYDIRTFSRGGSDITGAIIARAVEADVYENWTDVNGFMTADPRIVTNPKRISTLTYRELRELAYMGANVLHPESIFPVKYKNIPINIRNTFEPQNPGTMIVASMNGIEDEADSIITGIAGKKGYSIVYIEKSMMNTELGFARKVLSAFEYYNITFEHMPSGIDTICVVVSQAELEGKEEILLNLIRESVHPDKMEIINDIALIATVGHNMAKKIGTASTLFSALAKAGVNIRMIDQGSSELNIIVGVDGQDYEKSIKAIYDIFNK